MDLTPVPNVAFAGTACFACYRAPPDVPTLKRCSGCKRVKFCSPECSKTEWKDHKPFCQAFATVRARPHALLPPLYDPLSASDIASRRETQRAQWLLEDELLTAGLGREQTLLEGKLLWREPRCGVCWDREADVEGREGEDIGWRGCQKCRVVGWCSASHEDVGKEDHLMNEGSDGMTQCQTMRLSNEIDEFFLRHHLASPSEPPHLWIPSTPLASPPASWDSYLLPSILPSPTPSAAQIHGVFLEALSPVLTIYSALVASHQRPSLVLQIIDASPEYTGLHLPVYEELLHLLPRVKSLSLYLIGSNFPSSLSTAPAPQPTCGMCTTAHKTRAAHWVPNTSYPSLPASVPKPDLIAAFSPAVSASLPYWTPILTQLYAKGIPALFTAKTEEEAQDDFTAVCEVLDEKEGKRMWGPRRNVWSGGRPNVDGWEEDGIWRENEWVWGVAEK